MIPSLAIGASGTSDALATVAGILNWAIWRAFLGELIAMLTVVRSRAGYLRHNILNVLVVLTPPFLPELFQSLRAARVLRLARLLRLAPLFRRTCTLRGLRYATFFTGLVVFTGAAAFEHIEPDIDYFDGVYWAVTTVTTVGYGDVLPTTTEAKVLAMVLMVVGIGYFAVITGAIADQFLRGDPDDTTQAAVFDTGDEAELGQLRAHVDRLAQHSRELTAQLEALRLALPLQPAAHGADAIDRPVRSSDPA